MSILTSDFTANCNFSDYIVYVDESGDHSLESINPDYPVFVLAFCVFEKHTYASLDSPALQKLKFKHFGHDIWILHEHDISKIKPPFRFLLDPNLRVSFFSDLNTMMTSSRLTLLAVVVHKDQYHNIESPHEHIYHIAMEYGLERLRTYLAPRVQPGQVTHVVFECRGKDEDKKLESEFRKMTALGKGFPSLDIVVCPKSGNSCGLQLADLMARPIGRHIINPRQRNRAFEIIKQKLWHGPKGEVNGWGLTVLP